MDTIKKKKAIKLGKKYLRKYLQYTDFTLMYYYPENAYRYFFHGRMVRTVSFTYTELEEELNKVYIYSFKGHFCINSECLMED